MGSVSIDGVAGITAIGAQLEVHSGAVAARASAIVAKTAADIVRDAQAIVPVDTGYLKSSIGFTMDSPFQATIGASANYAAFIEYGTSRMGPRPYMAPAFARNTPPFLAAAAALGAQVGP